MFDGCSTARRRRRFSRRPERGAMAVEFALLLPILVMLLIGVVTTGVSYSQGLGLTNAVREGSRFAASTPPVSAGAWSDWSDDVIARMRATQFDDPSIQTTVCVRLWKNDSDVAAVPAIEFDSSCPAAAGTPATPPKITAHSCAVSVWATRPFSINAVFVQFDRTMRRESMAQYERSC